MRHAPHKEQEKVTSEQRAYNRLKQRKEDKPYYQRYYTIYVFIIIIGWAANLLSGLTESSKLYAFFYSFLNNISYAKSISWLLVGVSIILLEIIHRLIASSYFKDLVENDIHTKEMTPKLIVMLSIGALSVALSFSGSFDLVRLTNEAPPPLIADKVSINELTAAYSPLVEDVKGDIQDFRSTREWKGRLSDDSARKWEVMKSNKQELQLQQSEALKNLSSSNLQLEIRTDSLNNTRQQLHESKVNEKGYGLGIVSIIAILVLYACLWYDEEYQERKALYLEKKYGAINSSSPVSKSPSQPSVNTKPNGQPPPYPATSNPTGNGAINASYGANNHTPLPMGYFTEAQRKEMATGYQNTPAQTCTGLYREESGDIATQNVVDDRYTIEHIYQKCGKTHRVRYNLMMINSRISQYERDLEEAKIKAMEEGVITNRQNWLAYWQFKRVELLEKMPDNV